MRLSFTGGEVGWTTKTSVPRTFSFTCTKTSPSEKREISASLTGRERYWAISSASGRFALPEKSLRSYLIAGLARSWLGREASNLRIRDPKSRAWPPDHAPEIPSYAPACPRPPRPVPRPRTSPAPRDHTPRPCWSRTPGSPARAPARRRRPVRALRHGPSRARHHYAGRTARPFRARWPLRRAGPPATGGPTDG